LITRIDFTASYGAVVFFFAIFNPPYPPPNRLRRRSNSQNQQQFFANKKRLAQAKRRLEELFVLTQKLFEANALGKITDAEYSRIKHGYDVEQTELASTIEALEKSFANQKAESQGIDQFVATVKKLLNPEELTPRLIRELVDRIEIGQIAKIDGKRVQPIKIVYRFVGEI
jgi:hypothetical protein